MTLEAKLLARIQRTYGKLFAYNLTVTDLTIIVVLNDDVRLHAYRLTTKSAWNVTVSILHPMTNTSAHQIFTVSRALDLCMEMTNIIKAPVRIV